MWVRKSVECAEVDHIFHGVKAGLTVLSRPEFRCIARDSFWLVILVEECNGKITKGFIINHVVNAHAAEVCIAFFKPSESFGIDSVEALV